MEQPAADPGQPLAHLNPADPAADRTTPGGPRRGGARVCPLWAATATHHWRAIEEDHDDYRIRRIPATGAEGWDALLADS
jgi:hypothetical protein